MGIFLSLRAGSVGSTGNGLAVVTVVTVATVVTNGRNGLATLWQQSSTGIVWTTTAKL